MNSRGIAVIALRFIILTIPLMNAGCSSTHDNPYSQSLGSYRKSPEVSRLFNTYQLPPDFKYYYAGFIKDTDGLFGIHSDYLIAEICGRGTRAVHWHEFESTPQNLETLTKGIEFKGKPYGADILDHAGRHLGILYTFEQIEYKPFVRILENNSVCVVPQYYTGGDRRYTN